MIPKKPHTRHRNNDMDTSRKAAVKAADPDRLNERQAIVLRTIKHAEPLGLTDYDLEEECGSHGSTWRTRRAELVEGGLVYDTKERRKRLGRWRAVWRIVGPDTPQHLIKQPEPDPDWDEPGEDENEYRVQS